MQHTRCSIRIGVVFALLVVAGSVSVMAQARKPAQPSRSRSSEAIRIRKLEGVGRQSLVKTPEYRVDVGRDSGRAREWGQISVTYETGRAKQWLDEVTVNYFVMAENPADNEKPFSLYKLSVTYLDVEGASSHLSTVYLRPAALKRFGPVLGVAVEIEVDREKVASEQISGGKLKQIAEWWKNPTVVDSERLTRRDGYLLPRSRSPFALVNIDSHEAEAIR